ncbi:MAG: diacylglycerol kinase family protein [Bacteroidota bacterium]
MGTKAKNNSDKWLVVVNPNAGSRKGEKDWPKINDLLIHHGFIFESMFTKNRRHAIALTSDMIKKGFRQIIVVGGDGTLNEVVNGIFQQDSCKPDDIIIGLIPVGTGNDWGRTYKFPKKYHEAIKVLKKGHHFTQDVGYVTYHDAEGEHERYFINVSGMGYDALVAQKTNRLKDQGKGNAFSYLLNIFTGLFQYKYAHFCIKADGIEVFNDKVLSMNLGICKYNGGGLMQVPDAIPDDGMLDITIIHAISKFKIIKHVAQLYDGSFIKQKFVDTHRAKECKIVSKPQGKVFLEADGESLGHSPLLFTVKKRALRFIIPQDEDID